jgi:hypothetical protein
MDLDQAIGDSHHKTLHGTSPGSTP